MKHIAEISVKRETVPAKAVDAAGEVFLQIWLYVFTSILMAGFGLKK